MHEANKVKTILKLDAYTMQKYSNCFLDCFFPHFWYRFENDESLSELDEEIILPKNARVIQANVKGKLFLLKIE